MIQSMTQGNPLKLIILFSIPIMLGNLFQQVYILSDLYILGHYLGLHALAVAGAMTPVFVMTIMFATGFTNGLCVITAQRFGANDICSVRKSFSGGILLTAILCIGVMISLNLMMDTILHKMNVPADIYDDSKRFLTILSYSLFATLFYNYLAGIMRALGDSRTPLYFLIFASLLNIAINVPLIAYFHWDVTGAALGTGVAQTVSALLCVCFLFWRFPILRLKQKDWRLNFSFLLEHLKIAVPMSIQFSVIGIGVIIIQSICNSFGTDTIAAFASAGRIEQIMTMPLFSLGMALTTYSAQNYGGRYIRRIRQGVLQCFLFSGTISFIMAIIAYHFGEDLAGIFLNHPSEFVLNQATGYIKITTLFYFFLSMIFVFRQVLQGMGYPMLPLISGIVELVMRGFAAWYLSVAYGYIGICYASPIAWIGGAMIVTVGYFIIIRRFKVSLFGKLDQKSPVPNQVRG